VPRGGYQKDVASSGKSWSERLGERGTATHGRRVALYVVLLVGSILGTIDLLVDPSGATHGYRFGFAVAPIGVLLFAWGLARELRSGDTRDWRPIDSIRGRSSQVRGGPTQK
jgi:hypothetical protein